MNGRIYDPVIGKMISPDPIIQSPDNLQSFNRYSYVWNNPLTHTDPSGFVTQSTATSAGASGNYENYCEPIDAQNLSSQDSINTVSATQDIRIDYEYIDHYDCYGNVDYTEVIPVVTAGVSSSEENVIPGRSSGGPGSDIADNGLGTGGAAGRNGDDPDDDSKEKGTPPRPAEKKTPAPADDDGDDDSEPGKGLYENGAKDSDVAKYTHGDAGKGTDSGLASFTLQISASGVVGHFIFGGGTYMATVTDRRTGEKTVYTIVAVGLGVGLPSFRATSKPIKFEVSDLKTTSASFEGYGYMGGGSLEVGGGIKVGGGMKIPNGPFLPGDMIGLDYGGVDVSVSHNVTYWYNRTEEQK